MTPKKIAILGNCQARPLASFIERAVPDALVTYVGIVHLLRDEDRHGFGIALAEADVIITQRIADNYPCSFVRTAVVEGQHSDKLLRVANLYFRGYNPELRYLRRRGFGTLRGPLGDYHLQTVLDSWREGARRADACSRLVDIDFNRSQHAGVASASLDELKMRDVELDVPAAPLIEQAWTTNRLFFTFNHPSSLLLNQYFRTVADRLGLPVLSQSEADDREPLGQFRLPVNPMVRSSALQSEELVYRGVDVVSIDGWSIGTGLARAWQIEEIVDRYWEIYDANDVALRQLSAAA